MNKPTPKIYRTTNWSSYNQDLINHGNMPCGLILILSVMNNRKENKVEIKHTLTQQSNVA